MTIGHFKNGKVSGIAKEIGDCVGGKGFYFYGMFEAGRKKGYGECYWSDKNNY